MLTLAGMVVRVGWKSGGTQAALHSHLKTVEGASYQIAQTLAELCDTNRLIGLPEEGIRQAKEASGIFERLGDTVKQAECLIELARLLHSDEQLDAAEEAASRAINLLPEKGKQLNICQGHRALGYIYYSRVRQRKPSTISRWPSELHPLSTTTPSCFGFISPWRTCFLGMGGSKTHTLTSGAPSHTRSTTYTFWLVGLICRPGSDMNNVCLKRRNWRHSVLLVCLRSSGLRVTQSTLESSLCGSALASKETDLEWWAPRSNANSHVY